MEDGAENYILDLGTTANTSEHIKLRVYYKSGVTTLSLKGQGWKYGFSSEIVPELKINEWIHVGMVCDINVGCELYINGCLIRQEHQRQIDDGNTVATSNVIYGRKRSQRTKQEPVTNMYYDDIYIWQTTVPKEYFYILYTKEIF